MQVNEATLKQELVLAFKKSLPGAVVFRHEDKFRAGIPDISVTWNRMTTWLEVKYITSRLIQRRIQHVTVCDLAEAGSCFYVHYVNKPPSWETVVIEPRTGYRWLTTTFRDHHFVVRFIRDHHDQKSVRCGTRQEDN